MDRLSSNPRLRNYDCTAIRFRGFGLSPVNCSRRFLGIGLFTTRLRQKIGFYAYEKRPVGCPQDPEDDLSSLVAYEEFRRYRALNCRRHEQMRRQHQRVKRQRLFRQFGLPALIALGSGAAAWAFMSYGPALSPLPSFNSSPSVAQSAASVPFATALPLGPPEPPAAPGTGRYAPHLDADGDGIACEWSWRNWFR